MKEPAGIRILLVEDDGNMRYILQENLVMKGYAPVPAGDGEEGLARAKAEKFGLYIIDVMLPKMDGFQLATKIRTFDDSTPIIFLTSRSSEPDRLQGFKIGCDDYITKPFSLMELDYRIQAILKRTYKTPGNEEPPVFRIGIFEFDYSLRILRAPGQSEKKLTRKEGELLRLFCEKKNALINRNFIMNHVWGNDDYFISKSMEVYLTRIRHLLKADPNLEIVNVYGTGYQLLEKK
ncbi:MAG TPA: response regulator transcription factor [Bacteroidia bacterium]|nr:response regulator transcription factor [Bacteroidia bacterium]HNP98763.1 response regulator transcription factor [Bacteroidia bacterium]